MAWFFLKPNWSAFTYRGKKWICIGAVGIIASEEEEEEEEEEEAEKNDH